MQVRYFSAKESFQGQGIKKAEMSTSELTKPLTDPKF